MTTLNVAAVQYDIVWFDREANFELTRPLIAGAVASGAQLVLLPETFSTGFGFTRPGIGEPEDGPSATFLREQAAEHDVWVGGSCPEVSPGADRPSNVFVLAGPDGTVHRYKKIHPFSHSGEHEHVLAGDQFVTVDIEGVRVTLFICYDLRFADEFWATGPSTDAFLVVANWPAKRRHHWQTMLRARAIENQCYVVACNRVGTDDFDLDHIGDSTAIDPMGNVLVEAAGQQTVIHATIDTDVVESTRSHFRFLQDRR